MLSLYDVEEEQLFGEAAEGGEEPGLETRQGQVRISSSKYDYVKVKVWLHDHYYILSRFLISRMLTCIRVPVAEGIRISLELKKRLVDRGEFSVDQDRLLCLLFDMLDAHGYGSKYARRFRMMNELHQRRMPILILISGTGCVGKSFIATQLAERMNVPNVLQTNLVMEFLLSMQTDSASDDSNRDSADDTPGISNGIPVAYRRFSDREHFLREWRRECAMVRRAVQTDLSKCIRDGKPLILEGLHMDPELYIDVIDEMRSMGRGIVIPWVFAMPAHDHMLFVQNWLSRSSLDRQFAQVLSDDVNMQTEAVLSNFRHIQDYLCSHVPPFEKVVLDAQTIPETVDDLHRSIIDRIQTEIEDFLPRSRATSPS